MNPEPHSPEFHVVFHTLDWLPLALYVVFLLVVGFWPRKEDTEGYMIANRSLSIPVFVATLVATWYGGILGAGEFVYTDGVAAWVSNGLPYYVFAIIFAAVLARRVRGGAAHLYTIPDKFAQAYDRKTAVLAACFAFFYAAPATYILMTGTLLHLLFGWPLLPAMIVGILFSIAYVFRGGFLSDVRVNTLQFVLMFVGFLMVTGICLAKFGGFAYLAHSANLPPTHLKPLGTHNLAWAAVWFFIALTTLSDPGFHQRCYAARTPRTAAVGILIAVLCWMLFDALTTTSGLFARALIPVASLPDPTMAFPALAERVLPAGMKGLFYVGMLAPIMASLVSYTFIAAVTVGRDLIWRLRSDPDETKVPHYTRYGLIASSLFALFVAIKIPSVVQQWYAFGNIFVPGMLIPLLGAYSPSPRWKTTSHFAFLSMLGGASVALAWLLWGWKHGALDDPKFYPLGWQPMFPGLLIAAIFYAFGLLPNLRRPEVTS